MAQKKSTRPSTVHHPYLNVPPHSLTPPKLKSPVLRRLGNPLPPPQKMMAQKIGENQNKLAIISSLESQIAFHASSKHPAEPLFSFFNLIRLSANRPIKVPGKTPRARPHTIPYFSPEQRQVIETIRLHAAFGDWVGAKEMLQRYRNVLVLDLKKAKK